MGIALFISASVLSGCNDSEKTAHVEKKAVFYKIKAEPKAVVTTSPTPIKQIIDGQSTLPQKEIAPPLATTTVEKKGGDIIPIEVKIPAPLAQKEISSRLEIVPSGEKVSTIKSTDVEISAPPVSEADSAAISTVADSGEKNTQGENPEESKPLVEIKKTAPEKEEPVAKELRQKESRFWLYHAEEGDTLWDIAKKYYGKGKYYPVLLEHNPHVGIYDIGRGVTLNILKNRERALEHYKKIILRKDGHIYWRYCVASGDTLQSIVEKYYKKGQAKSDIPNIDKSSELKPGEKIWILIK